MRTGITKRKKTTAIYFDEYGSMIEVQTHNTDLKKRLTAFAAEYPQCCCKNRHPSPICMQFGHHLAGVLAPLSRTEAPKPYNWFSTAKL